MCVVPKGAVASFSCNWRMVARVASLAAKHWIARPVNYAFYYKVALYADYPNLQQKNQTVPPKKPKGKAEKATHIENVVNPRCRKVEGLVTEGLKF